MSVQTFSIIQISQYKSQKITFSPDKLVWALSFDNKNCVQRFATQAAHQNHLRQVLTPLCPRALLGTNEARILGNGTQAWRCFKSSPGDFNIYLGLRIPAIVYHFTLLKISWLLRNSKLNSLWYLAKIFYIDYSSSSVVYYFPRDFLIVIKHALWEKKVPYKSPQIMFGNR